MFSAFRISGTGFLKRSFSVKSTNTILERHGVLNNEFVAGYCKSSLSELNKPEIIQYHQVRHAVSGFFCKIPADQIWKGVSSVSNAGKKRGRGKTRGKKVIRDLNKGQIIGIGKENIRFPGLSAPILRGRELIQQHKLPPDEKYEENLIKLRQPLSKMQKVKVAPIDRGWTGGHAEGVKIGPPDPIGEDNFEGFESIILDQRPVFTMTSHFGRYRTVAVICGTGNGNGLFGFGSATAPQAKPAMRRAKNRAAQKLIYVPRCEDRTILHNFTARFGSTILTAWKMSEGYGLKCHRLLKSICELIGIKDLIVKVEGGYMPLNLIKCFMMGLVRQKSFEELASETKLHVVELDQFNNNFPKVLASPADPIEHLDEPKSFDLHCFDDRVYVKNIRPPPFYESLPQWPIQLRKMENIRSHHDTKCQLLAEYGELRSFLSDKYPECRPQLPKWTMERKKKEREARLRGTEP